jgi:single-stranded DNA-binding protein
MHFLNKVLLCGTVASATRIRSFTTMQGRILCFDLMTGRPGGRCEHHRVVARDGARSRLASRSEGFVVPGSTVFVTGSLRYRARAGVSSGIVTEIDASAIDLVDPALQDNHPQAEARRAECVP